PLPEHPSLRQLWSGADYEGQPRFVYENADAMPRAFFVDGYRVAAGREALALLAGGSVDLRRTAVLEKRPAFEPVGGAGGEVAIASYGFNRVALRAKNESPSLLVLADVYYPDWKATVDGRPVEVLRANHILRALALPAGEHDIEFAYDTSLIVRSLIVSATTMGAALLVLIGYVIAYARKGKRGSSGRHTHVQRA
ncbi:MAG: YfhO family protein, partial [Candidatus Krumholzibacteria bacterium]|nr:YfhO family protein [Candidatus Krumholzibacteria bacterium]